MILRARMTPYPRDVVLFDDREKFKRYLDRHCTACKNPSMHAADEGCNGRIVNIDNRAEFVIGVFNGDLSTLVHELGHAVITLFDQIGLEINFGSSEAFTYLQGEMFKRCRNALNDHASKKRKRG